MELHRKQFEEVYASDATDNKIHKLKFELISVADGRSLDKYILDFRSFLNNVFEAEFNAYVRLSWMRRIFCFNNKKTRMPMKSNSFALNLAFVKLMRRCIGKDIQIFTRPRFFSKIETYFEDFFPGFMEGNPFTNPEYYKFPFKNISMEYLTVVHQMDDRIDLLKEADRRGMTYAVFQDYVINFAYSENLRLKRQKYIIKQNQDRNFSFCVIDGDKEKKRLNKLKKKTNGA